MRAREWLCCVDYEYAFPLEHLEAKKSAAKPKKAKAKKPPKKKAAKKARKARRQKKDANKCREETPEIEDRWFNFEARTGTDRVYEKLAFDAAIKKCVCVYLFEYRPNYMFCVW